MTQLVRLKLGDDVEEDHMVNRQWVSAWVFEKGQKDNVIEKVTRDGKTYFNIKDYVKLRELFGELLRETQRIKSEGDFEAAKAPYSGFANPVLVPDMDATANEITDIKILQPAAFDNQMLFYAKNYSFLTDKN